MNYLNRLPNELKFSILTLLEPDSVVSMLKIPQFYSGIEDYFALVKDLDYSASLSEDHLFKNVPSKIRRFDLEKDRKLVTSLPKSTIILIELSELALSPNCRTLTVVLKNFQHVHLVVSGVTYTSHGSIQLKSGSNKPSLLCNLNEQLPNPHHIILKNMQFLTFNNVDISSRYLSVRNVNVLNLVDCVNVQEVSPIRCSRFKNIHKIKLSSQNPSNEYLTRFTECFPEALANFRSLQIGEYKGFRGGEPSFNVLTDNTVKNIHFRALREIYIYLDGDVSFTDSFLPNLEILDISLPCTIIEQDGVPPQLVLNEIRAPKLSILSLKTNGRALRISNVDFGVNLCNVLIVLTEYGTYGSPLESPVLEISSPIVEKSSKEIELMEIPESAVMDWSSFRSLVSLELACNDQSASHPIQENEFPALKRLELLIPILASSIPVITAPNLGHLCINYNVEIPTTDSDFESLAEKSKGLNISEIICDESRYKKLKTLELVNIKVKHYNYDKAISLDIDIAEINHHISTLALTGISLKSSNNTIPSNISTLSLNRTEMIIQHSENLTNFIKLHNSFPFSSKTLRNLTIKSNAVLFGMFKHLLRIDGNLPLLKQINLEGFNDVMLSDLPALHRVDFGKRSIYAIIGNNLPSLKSLKFNTHDELRKDRVVKLSITKSEKYLRLSELIKRISFD